MMMECPRCAFVQPQDRFCANCGLNVETYQAKPKPFMDRLLGSPALFLGLAVVFVVFAAVFLSRSKVPQVERPVVEQNAPVTGGAMPTASPSTATAAPGFAAPQPAPAPPPPPGPRPVAPPVEPKRAELQTPAAPTVEVAEPETTEASSATPAAPAVPAVKMPAQVEISFYEVPREAWQPVAAEAKSLGDQGGWRVLQFAAKDKLSPLLGGARRLPGQRSMATQASSNASLHFPTGAAEAHQGLYFDFSAVKNDAGILDVEVSGQIALKVDATTDIQSRFETVASMPAAGAVVLVGNLTRKDLPEAMATQLASSPLSVLNSPDFIEGASELILVITGR